jgi:hypothetical protein
MRNDSNHLGVSLDDMFGIQRLKRNSINSNAIPCASWMLIEALKRPGLLQTLRSEVAPSMIKHEKDGVRVDLPSLLANSPLLISMYME